MSLHMSWECPGTCKHQEKRADQRLHNCERKTSTAMVIQAKVDLTASSCMYRYACVDQLSIEGLRTRVVLATILTLTPPLELEVFAKCISEHSAHSGF